jgi:uncharacterized damage-inducible protein DinB
MSGRLWLSPAIRACLSDQRSHGVSAEVRDNGRTMIQSPDPLRTQLASVLDWGEAHVGFDKATAGIPPDKRGALAAGFGHSPWQLLEHIRIAQKDILAFCVSPTYLHDLSWPDDYWPSDPVPTAEAAWDDSIAGYKSDCATLQQLALNAQADLLATVPTGDVNQTLLRGILLAASHASYHLGQLVAVRRALGIWT